MTGASGRTASVVRFVQLPLPALTALLAHDRFRASEIAGVELTEFIEKEDWLWRIRAEQVARDPESAEWVARAAVVEGRVIGHGGFHGPPDARGMVEVAYTVDPHYRRRGHARAILAALIERCRRDPRVRVVRASISPDNLASLATLDAFPFVPAGDQWDEEDGLELLFELSVE